MQAFSAVSEPTSPALWGRLLKRCQNLPPGHRARGADCLMGVGTYLLSTAGQGCRVFKQCQFLLHQQVRGAELDIVLLLF